MTAVTKISALKLKDHSRWSITIDMTSCARSPGHVLGPTIFHNYHVLKLFGALCGKEGSIKRHSLPTHTLLGVFIYIYIYIYILCKYILFAHVYIHVYVNKYAYIHLSLHIHVYVYVYVCTYILGGGLHTEQSALAI